MENSANENILVTCGGGIQGLTLFKSIAVLDGVVSHLFDSNKENISKYFFDYFFHSTSVSNHKQCEDELIRYCIQYQISLIVPATIYDLSFLAQRKLFFSAKLNCRVAVPDEKYVNIFTNKRKAQAFLHGKGFPVQQEENFLNSEAYPLIGKALNGWGGKGVIVIKTLDELKVGRYDPLAYYWTRYIADFKEYSIDFSVNHQGEVSPPLVRERLSISGGFALISQSIPLPAAIFSLVSRAFSDPALIGVYNLQYISTNDKIFFTDLNPRMGTSAVLGHYFGTNPIAHLLGRRINCSKSRPPVKVIRYIEERFLSIKDHQVSDGRLKEFWNSYSIIETAKRNGVEEGAKNREVEIARLMKKENFSVAQISRITALSEKQIEEL